MRSKWFGLKQKVVSLRYKGLSIRDIENKLGVARSTLSGWLKNVSISIKHRRALKIRQDESLIKARKKALIWHHEQKRLRVKNAKDQALVTLAGVDIKDRKLIDIALSMLYLGEGFKTSKTGMGNSDPLILKFFLKNMIEVYNLDINKIRFELHLRYDQNSMQMKKYWSQQLKVPIARFSYVSFDKRTKGQKTYPHYKGVCLIDCANIAIQRKLIYLSRKFCELYIKKGG